MGRILFVGGLVCLALGLVAMPALADNDEGLRQEVEKLRQEMKVLKTSMLDKEIDEYLAQNDAWRGAQGGGLSGVSIHARLTAVVQATVGLDDSDSHAVNGDVELDFDFTVTDNLDLFVYLVGNAQEENSQEEVRHDPDNDSGAFPNLFDSGSRGVPARSFSMVAGPTLAGFTDGIGVNGTVGTSFGEEQGGVAVYETGIHHSIAVGDNRLHWEIGRLDPRKRFNQNAFADDENGQFIHNSFDDTAAAMWLSDASGREYYAIHMWISFGGNKQFTLNWGWFNSEGRFFDQGQFYFQFSWKGEVNGREMNLRVFGFVDEFFRDGTNDGSSGGGVSWDWWVNDKIGVFVRAAGNGDDVNPIEFDASLGVIFNGLIGSRPDDTLGVAVGFISTNDNVFEDLGLGTPDEDTEITLEIYYRFMAEDGKLQITPHIIFVSDPGGGENYLDFSDDALFILGIRIHVPF